MRNQIAFFRCNVCGNIVELIRNGGGTLVCCEQPMQKLTANTTDASAEKHVPIGERVDGRINVKVGSIPHPMTNEHYIQWIAVVSDEGIERINLSPSDKPEAFFCGKENVDIYEYCNLHGLWKSSL